MMHRALTLLYFSLFFVSAPAFLHADVDVASIPPEQAQPPEPPPIIVIDPGHGGKDPGAIGKQAKVREKDVTLQIAKRLAPILKKKLGAQVFLTRSTDTFISLEGRNRIANLKEADLFLSIHANAATNSRAHGLEIYYLNKATDQASRRLAARENKGAPKKESELEAIVSDLLQTAATEESSEMAANVQTHFRQKLVKKYKIPFVHVKTALFYVLVGAKCPSLLIETGFVTHPKEGKRLKQAAYQKELAEAIAEGVVAYWKQSEAPRSDL